MDCYRDLEALSAAGVPVVTEAGPGGGCRLMDGYRFPLRGLRPDEAEALLILGVPTVLHELGLAGALAAAHRQIRVTAGLTAAALVHLDMPRWFGGQEEAPCLRDLARALRLGRKLAISYPSPDREPRVVGPLGLVNKAGTWYLVAEAGDVRVFRAARVSAARVLAEPVERPADFELASFWARWSAEFEASRPRLEVRLAASPHALSAFGEVFGPAAAPALEAAEPPGQDGWRGDAVVRARAGGRAPAGRIRRSGRGPGPARGPGRPAGHRARDPRPLPGRRLRWHFGASGGTAHTAHAAGAAQVSISGHALAAGFSRGFEVSAAIMVLALVVGAAMIRVTRQDRAAARA